MQSRYSAKLMSSAILALIIILFASWWLVLEPLFLHVIRGAYQNESIEILNNVIESGESHPLEWYIARGKSLSDIALMAVIGYLVFALLILRPEVFGHDVESRRLRLQLQSALLVISLIAISTSVISGPLHDYRGYLKQWNLVISGQEPWGEHSGNAYGPAYNLFAIFYGFHPLLPKLLFCLTWLSCITYILGLYVRLKIDAIPTWTAFAFLALNPLFWVHTVIYGNFDIAVAAACLAAVGLRCRGQDRLAAVLLALAVLMKFYPMAMAPFLMFDGRRFNWRFSIAFSVSILAGFLASVVIWGVSTIHPLLFATERVSKLVSIFRFLRGEMSPLHLFTESPNVDFLSLPLMVLVGGLLFIIAWIRRFGVITATILGTVAALTLYKVGHPQFLAVVILLIWYWYARERSDCLNDNILIALPTIAYSSWIAAVTTVYLLTHLDTGGTWGIGMQEQWLFLRDFIGLPTFLLATWMLVEIVRDEARRSKAYMDQ